VVACQLKIKKELFRQWLCHSDVRQVSDLPKDASQISGLWPQ